MRIKSRPRGHVSGPLAFLGCGGAIALWAAALAGVALLFQYSLFSITGRDVPWWADLLGGAILNGLNLPIAAICFLLRLAGMEPPFFQP